MRDPASTGLEQIKSLLSRRATNLLLLKHTAHLLFTNAPIHPTERTPHCTGQDPKRPPLSRSKDVLKHRCSNAYQKWKVLQKMHNFVMREQELNYRGGFGNRIPQQAKTGESPTVCTLLSSVGQPQAGHSSEYNIPFGHQLNTNPLPVQLKQKRPILKMYFLTF